MKILPLAVQAVLAGVNGLLYALLVSFVLFMLVEWPGRVLYGCFFLFWALYLAYHLWGVVSQKPNLLSRNKGVLLGFGLFLCLLLAIFIPGNSAVVNRSRNLALKQNLYQAHQFLQQQAQTGAEWPADARSLEQLLKAKALKNPYTADTHFAENYSAYQQAQADPAKHLQFRGLLLYAPLKSDNGKVQSYQLYAVADLGRLLPEQVSAAR